MNQRNKTKLAVLIPSHKPLDRWYLLNDGLFGALRILSKKYNIKVFGYSDVPAFIDKHRFAIQLFDNSSSLRYWLKGFSPKYVIGYGEADKTWDEVIEQDYLPTDESIYRLGLNTQGLGSFSTHIEFYATDTDYFKPIQANRVYPALFTMPIANPKQLPPGSLALISGSNDFQEVFESGHIVSTTTRTPLVYSQAQGVITNDIEVALEALSCNTPVLTTLLDLDGLWKCPDDEIGQAYLQMVISFNNSELDLRKDFIESKADHIKLAERIRKCLTHTA
jgi:hypothetical protein